MSISDVLLNQIGPVVVAAAVGVFAVAIKAVSGVAIELIQKKQEEVEQKLQLDKHQGELEAAREVWNIVDEKFRISSQVGSLMEDKAKDFDELLLKKIPYLTEEEVSDIRQTIAGEMNKWKTTVF